MIKTIILVTLLVASSYATFAVNFHVEDIKENLYGDQSDDAVEVEDADYVLVSDVKINNKNTHATFDTTIGHSWQYQAEEEPQIHGEYGDLPIFNGRATLEEGEETQLGEVIVAGKHLKKVPVVIAHDQIEEANESLTELVQYGFALDRNEQHNFLKDLTDNKIKLEKYGFSFHISEKINQVIFGGPQNFFSAGESTVFDIADQSSNQWTLKVAQNSINLKTANSLATHGPIQAVIDSTTRYIWADHDLVDSIVQELNGAGLNLNCHDVSPNNPVGVYECDDGVLPTLNIGFVNKDNKSVSYQITHYHEHLDNKKVRLLIRKAGAYTQDLEFVPEMEQSQTESNLILGTIFLENVYTYFNAEKDQLELSQAFRSHVQESNISSAARLWYLILGGILLAALLGALLWLIKEVPYTAPSQISAPVKTAAHQVVPQNTLVQQQYQNQQPVLQSYVRTVQPQTYYVQQQPQNVVLSPSRVYQTQYVPK